MRHRFDRGVFIEDLERIVNDASQRQPSLIVVPTEREVRTFERNFKDKLNGQSVFCCSFADYYTGQWMMINPRPRYIFGFREDDVYYNLSGDAEVVYTTSKGKKRFIKDEETVKEEETHEEE